jgi:hypothetical protein
MLQQWSYFRFLEAALQRLGSRYYLVWVEFAVANEPVMDIFGTDYLERNMVVHDLIESLSAPD